MVRVIKNIQTERQVYEQVMLLIFKEGERNGRGCCTRYTERLFVPQGVEDRMLRCLGVETLWDSSGKESPRRNLLKG